MLISMKKLLLSLALITGFMFAANAQTERALRKLSLGADFGIPIGDSSKDQILVGGSLLYEQPISQSLSLTGSVGYLSKQLTGDTRTEFKALGWPTRISNIPIKAGMKYYFGRYFYAAAELGAAITTSSGGGEGFIYAAGVGASLPLSKKSSLDIGLRFENWSYRAGTDRFVALRAAYSFGL